MYCRFINENSIEIAPLNYITEDNVTIFNFNSDEDIMKEYGYKPLNEGEKPEGIVTITYEDTKDEIVTHYEVIKTPEEIEKERIAQLNLTGADVERGIYKAKGMDFEDVIKFIENSKIVGIDIKALRIELSANNFYRGNPYVSSVGKILGFSEEALDKFFEDGNYQHLLEQEQE